MVVRRRAAASQLTRFAPAALVVAAFVAPGAWLVTRLPPIPIAKGLQLATMGLWCLAIGLGFCRFELPARRLLWGVAAIGVSVSLSYLAGGSLPEVLLYDLFAEMPLIHWVAFPVVFVLAAGMRLRAAEILRALGLVVVLGVFMAGAMTYGQLVSGGNGVFGSTAYSITALAPLIPLGAVLAFSSDGAPRAIWVAATLVIAVVLSFFSGSMTGAVATLFGVSASIVVLASGTRRTRARLAWLAGGLLASALLILALLVVQLPALSGAWATPARLGALDKNTVSRLYLWEGAQSMLMARPVLGFGPSGYRLRAAEFLRPDALQFGADTQGNADPTVYSPQSPHSIVWEVATRLGLLGLLAFAAMGALWGLTLQERLTAAASEGVLRIGLAASFITALVCMLVNPVLFAIGLLAPVMAGLAVSPHWAAGEFRSGDAPRRWGLAAAGILVILVAAWLSFGEWRAFEVRFALPEQAIRANHDVLRVLPGHPMSLRRLLENEILAASDDQTVRAAQLAVDASSTSIRSFAPNMVNFTAYSLAQAERTGRRNLGWEARQLAEAAVVLPPIPSLVAERLHLAVLAGDPVAVRAALPDAERWGGPYPYTQRYIDEAKTLLSGR